MNVTRPVIVMALLYFSWTLLRRSQKNKVDAIINGNDYMAPCNIPGGACSSDDPDAAAVLYAQGGWYPWA